MNFQQADRRYVDLKQQYDNGSLSAEAFEAQLEQLMVHDEEDRWWSKHPETGEWHYFNGDTWVRGIPPAYEKDIPEVTTKKAPTEPTSAPYPGDISNGEEHRRRGLPRGLVAAGLIGMVAIAGIGIVVWLLLPLLLGEDDDFSAAATVTLPDVVGMSQGEAEEALRADGFEVTVDNQESSLKERGMVVEQSPPGGEEAEESSTVAITVGAKPAPGYQLIDDGSGNLTLEVPSGWEFMTGEESEGDPGANSWSKYEDVSIGSSITAAYDLDGNIGIYGVASRKLAQKYTDHRELAVLGPNDGSTWYCKRGESQDLNRSSYSGRIQAWDCPANDESEPSTLLTLAAAPQGRECVVALQMWTYNKADREVAEHIVDTFEVDCSGL